MRTEQLIAELASRAMPVTRLASPLVRWAAFCGVALGSAAIAWAVFGPRRNLTEVVGTTEFIALALLVAGVAAVAAMTALILAVPGAERSRALRVSTLSLCAVWTALGLTSVVRGGHGLSDASDWYVCFVRVIAIGLIPAWVLFGMLRRAAPLEPAYASAFAALGAMAVGSCEIQFLCPFDMPAHTFLGHIGPALALSGLGAWIAPVSAATRSTAAPADRSD